MCLNYNYKYLLTHGRPQELFCKGARYPNKCPLHPIRVKKAHHMGVKTAHAMKGHPHGYYFLGRGLNAYSCPPPSPCEQPCLLCESDHSALQAAISLFSVLVWWVDAAPGLNLWPLYYLLGVDAIIHGYLQFLWHITWFIQSLSSFYVTLNVTIVDVCIGFASSAEDLPYQYTKRPLEIMETKEEEIGKIKLYGDVLETMDLWANY